MIDRATLARYRDQLLFELANIFFEDAPRMGERVHAALADDDLPAVKRAAHQLRGCAANLGALAVAELAASIEAAAGAGDRDVAEGLAAELDDRIARAEAELREEITYT